MAQICIQDLGTNKQREAKTGPIHKHIFLFCVLFKWGQSIHSKIRHGVTLDRVKARDETNWRATSQKTVHSVTSSRLFRPPVAANGPLARHCSE